MRGRILVVDHKTPAPDEDSGSASTFSYLQILSRAGFEVTFTPFNLVNAGRYTSMLNDLGVKTLSAPEWKSMNAVIMAFAPRSDLLLLYRAPVAMHVFNLARRVAPATMILFHAVDLHFLRMQREAALSGIKMQQDAASAVRKIELDLIERADASIVVSNYELNLLRELVPTATVYQIPILRETPPQSPAPTPGLRQRSDFLFIGGYEHIPNVDAVRWFVSEVWPILQSRRFPSRFIIAGSKVPDDIAALASDKIEVRGYIEDLAPLFASCRLSVAPLRYGAGIKGKIVTSLSYGVPVVATSIAAEGADLLHDETILIADTPDEMADQIMRLYDDVHLWQRLSANGYQAFQDKFSLAAGALKVLAVVDGLVASARRLAP
jgi:glycosyltransferase involved in cell wall biosynthesis